MSEVAIRYDGMRVSRHQAPNIPSYVRKENTINSLTIRGTKVNRSQREVYDVLKSNRKGLPDHALVPLAQHVAGVRLSSSGIRTRRKELVDAGLVKATAKRVVMPSGRTAAIYKVAA